MQPGSSSPLGGALACEVVCHACLSAHLSGAVARPPVLGPRLGRALLNVRLRVVCSVGRAGSSAAVSLLVKWVRVVAEASQGKQYVAGSSGLLSLLG